MNGRKRTKNGQTQEAEPPQVEIASPEAINQWHRLELDAADTARAEGEAGQQAEDETRACDAQIGQLNEQLDALRRQLDERLATRERVARLAAQHRNNEEGARRLAMSHAAVVRLGCAHLGLPYPSDRTPPLPTEAIAAAVTGANGGQSSGVRTGPQVAVGADEALARVMATQDEQPQDPNPFWDDTTGHEGGGPDGGRKPVYRAPRRRLGRQDEQGEEPAS